MNQFVLSPAHADFLTRTTARNKALYGGWSMDGTDDAAKAAEAAAATAAAEKAAADKAAAEAAAASKNAVDDAGKDLGYPKDTPVAEMTDKEQAAYHRYHSRKHETRYKGLVGDRTPEQIKADLDELARLRKEQLTPSEQAIAAAKEEGKNEARTEERKVTATAIFRSTLENAGITESEIDDIVTGFNVSAYITDTGVDTTKITNFAKRFTKSDTDSAGQRRRDFGGGNRGGDGKSTPGSGGKAEAAKRFGKTKSGE